MSNIRTLARRLRAQLPNSTGSDLGNPRPEPGSDSGQMDAVKRKLVIGLGNPGKKYAENRHNIGFMVVDQLAKQHEIEMSRKKYKAYCGTGRVGNCPVILAKPQTYMNLSGDSVSRLSSFYDIRPSNILVVYDEIDLPSGTLRIREKGGSGGHNGMKSVIGQIGQGFPRIRLGVDRPPGRMDPAAYLLRDFEKDEWPMVEDLIAKAVAAIETILSQGLEAAMNHFNGALASDPLQD